MSRRISVSRPDSTPAPRTPSGVVPRRAPRGAAHCDGQALPLPFAPDVEIRGEGEPPYLPPAAYHCTPGSKWVDKVFGDIVRLVHLEFGPSSPGFRVRYKHRGGQYTVGLGVFLNQYKKLEGKP